MNDPKRWLEDEGASDLERDLLGAGVRLRAPRGMEARVWQGVGAKLSAAAVGGAVAASTTKAAASGGAGAGAGGAAAGGVAAGGLKAGAAGVVAFKTKLVVAALVVAGASTGGALVATRTPTPSPAQNMHSTLTATTSPPTPPAMPKPREVATPTESAPPIEPVAIVAPPTQAPPSAKGTLANVASRSAKPATERVPSPEPTAKSEPVAIPTEPSKGEPPKTEAASHVRDDARALQEARAALAAGDPEAAERRLAGVSSATILAPERDAVRVRIAAARGDHARARALAGAFLRAYPKSPLAPQMTKIVEGTTNE